jgi:type VI secretion system secreted protein Hcp
MNSTSLLAAAARRTYKSLLRCALAAAAFSMLVSAQAAFDVFVKLVPQNGTIVGDSKDPRYRGAEGWFEISSFEFGIENTINIGSVTGGGGAGKASFQKLVISKQVDQVSPKIFKVVGTGAHFNSATIAIRKAGLQSGTGEAYLVYDLNLVFASSQKWSGASGDDVPKETVSFQFGAAKITYFKQSQTGDLVKPGIIESWNIVNNNDNFEIDF